MPNQLDAMVDIETLDTLPTAAVLTIGAVLFDPRGRDTEESLRQGKTFYRVIPRDSNATYKRTESEDTLKWWAEQNAEAFAALTEGPFTPLDIALRELNEFLQSGEHKTGRMWANDPDFDCVILQDACRSTKAKWPIPFYMNRSVRTIKDLAYPDGEVPKIGVGVAHNALDDSIRQALVVQNCHHVIDGLHQLLHAPKVA
jgi:3'-5' exoribonuclease Rv2179c-like domain